MLVVFFFFFVVLRFFSEIPQVVLQFNVDFDKDGFRILFQEMVCGLETAGYVVEGFLLDLSGSLVLVLVLVLIFFAVIIVDSIVEVDAVCVSYPRAEGVDGNSDAQLTDELVG
jgi:hypothetical protein